MTLLDLLMRRIEHDTNGGCWLWPGALSHNGYAIVGGTSKTVHGAKSRQVHRLMYEAFRMPIPAGMVIDHLFCRVRCCVNPAHLEPVTVLENNRRGRGIARIFAAKTHCPQGHPYDEANTSLDARGYRKCRACMSRWTNKNARAARVSDAPSGCARRVTATEGL